MSGELTHYGVKGMRWGVRKARTGDIAVQRTVLNRVASGDGSRRDKLNALGLSGGLIKVRKTGGLEKAAAKTSAELQAESDRLSSGKATTKDVLNAYGSVSLLSVLKSIKD